MTRIALAAAGLLAIASAAFAQSQPVRYMPEPDFESLISQVAKPLEAQDAFAGLEECSVVDLKTFAPVTLAKAEEMMQECVKAVGVRYNLPVTLERVAASAEGSVSIQVEGLALYIPASVGITDPLMKDLSFGIEKRQHRILGHRVMIRRGAAPKTTKRVGAKSAASASVAQDAIDQCILPTVLRKIESSDDFIRYYGRCLVNFEALKIQTVRPSAGRSLSVTLLSLADAPTVRSLNGSLTVNAANGPVTVSVLAYPETTLE